jgi:hypothetical protein
MSLSKPGSAGVRALAVVAVKRLATVRPQSIRVLIAMEISL